MSNQNKTYFEMVSQIPCDTILNIKYDNNGKIAWCKYFIPTNRKNGTPVLFGELYQYFSTRKGFLFGLGYVAQDDPDGKHHTAIYQYFGFTAREPPHEHNKRLERPLILPKHIPKSKRE